MLIKSVFIIMIFLLINSIIVTSISFNDVERIKGDFLYKLHVGSKYSSELKKYGESLTCKSGEENGIIYYGKKTQKECYALARNNIIQLVAEGNAVRTNYLYDSNGCCAVELLESKRYCDKANVVDMNIDEGTSGVDNDKVSCSLGEDNTIIVDTTLSVINIGPECRKDGTFKGMFMPEKARQNPFLQKTYYGKPICTDSGPAWQDIKCSSGQGCSLSFGCEDLFCEVKDDSIIIKGGKSGRVYGEQPSFEIDADFVKIYHCSEDTPNLDVDIYERIDESTKSFREDCFKYAEDYSKFANVATEWRKSAQSRRFVNEFIDDVSNTLLYPWRTFFGKRILDYSANTALNKEWVNADKALRDSWKYVEPCFGKIKFDLNKYNFYSPDDILYNYENPKLPDKIVDPEGKRASPLSLGGVKG